MVTWTGDILVDGDIRITPEGTLVVNRDTRVRFAGTDRRGTGLDPVRCELSVQGKMFIKPGEVTFESQVIGETWYGIVLEAHGSIRFLQGLDGGVPAGAAGAINQGRKPEGVFTLSDAVYVDPALNILVDGSENEFAQSSTDDRATNVAGGQPTEGQVFALMQNYPNPFNPRRRFVMPCGRPRRCGWSSIMPWARKFGHWWMASTALGYIRSCGTVGMRTVGMSPAACMCTG